ncbi:hypothetical protein ACN469_41255 [Corallococcus terminator]
MLRQLSTLRSLTTLATLATLSTAAAEEQARTVASTSPKPTAAVSEARPEKVARTGASTLLAGNHSISIPAITCTPQDNIPSGNPDICISGATVRTDGDQDVPCMVRGGTTRRTYACALNLPAGAQLQEVIAYGMDYSTLGYFEASIWKTPDAGFTPSYISTFGGTWQSSGIAFNGGYASFPIFPATQPPHTVLAGERYVIGFATRDPNEFTYMGGFSVNYYLP